MEEVSKKQLIERKVIISVKPIVEFSARVYAVDRGDKQVKLTV